jgi:hypothetical protein
LAVRHTTTTKVPGFTPNTGVPQYLEVSAGVILEFRKHTASRLLYPSFCTVCGRKLGASGVVCFSKHGLGLKRTDGRIEFCTRAIRATLAFPWCGQNEKLSLFEL